MNYKQLILVLGILFQSPIVTQNIQGCFKTNNNASPKGLNFSITSDSNRDLDYQISYTTRSSMEKELNCIQHMHSDHIAICCNKMNDRDLFLSFHLYSCQNFINYLRQQSGYNSFILNLDNKISTNKELEKSVRYMVGFKGKEGFKDFIKNEAQNIRNKEAAQANIQKKQAEEAEIKRQKELCLREEKEPHLTINNQTLEYLTEELTHKLTYAQTNNDLYLTKRHTQRMKAIETILKDNTKSDYSKSVKSMPPSDSYGEIFDHCYGNALDRQLHDELCDIRTEMMAIRSQHPYIIQINTVAPIVEHFAALAKEQTDPYIAFNLSDCCHYMTKFAVGFARNSEIVLKGIDKGIINTFVHTAEFCEAIITHPIDDVVKPLYQAGIALGKALYYATELLAKDPSKFAQQSSNLASNLYQTACNNPEDTIAGIVELLIPLASTKVAKLKQVQLLIKAVQEQKQFVQAAQLTSSITTKIVAPIKTLITDASAMVKIGINDGKKAMKNVIKAIDRQPEAISVGDVAALKLPSKYLYDFEKLSDKAAELGYKTCIEKTINKILKISNDILDVMEKAGGHTLEKHVSQTINELMSRAAERKKIPISSFNNKHTAIKAVQENLRNNAKEIALWLKNDKTKINLSIDFTHKYSIGYGVPKGKKNPVYNLITSKVVLIKDPTQDIGFIILTAFPNVI